MVTAHVYPFDTVKSGRGYDSDPHYRSPVTAPGAVTPDEDNPILRFCAVLERNLYSLGSPEVRAAHAEMNAYMDELRRTPDRYPAPTTAELVTLWKRSGRVVMSVTAGGQTHDFYMPPARLVYLLRECAEQLAENTIIQ